MLSNFRGAIVDATSVPERNANFGAHRKITAIVRIHPQDRIKISSSQFYSQ